MLEEEEPSRRSPVGAMQLITIEGDGLNGQVGTEFYMFVRPNVMQLHPRCLHECQTRNPTLSETASFHR